MKQNEEFLAYLKEIKKDRQEVRDLFERFYTLLREENQKINLFSRKMDIQDIWTIHFLDSLTLSEVYSNIEKELILDFGTGGGMPGIPLNIVFPDNRFVFLDSIHKKINSVKNFCKMLDLNSCDFVCSRIEDIDSVWFGKFDRIVCRSVRVTPQFKDVLLRLLKPCGILNLYKAVALEDAMLFDKVQIFDVSKPALGERKIIEIRK